MNSRPTDSFNCFDCSQEHDGNEADIELCANCYAALKADADKWRKATKQGSWIPVNMHDYDLMQDAVKAQHMASTPSKIEVSDFSREPTEGREPPLTADK